MDVVRQYKGPMTKDEGLSSNLRRFGKLVVLRKILQRIQSEQLFFNRQAFELDEDIDRRDEAMDIDTRFDRLCDK